MGASAAAIERQIDETRNRMDENLGALEDLAASNAVRYGRMAAVAVGALALVGAAFLAYRRMSKPTLQERFMTGLDRVRMVAPAIVGAASTTLLERVARAGEGGAARRTPPPAD